MGRLEGVSAEELRTALGAVEGKKPAMRLLAAIAYKHGVTQTELAEWYGVERKTIYNWLTRIEERTIERAVVDEKRPGRPPKLGEGERSTLRADLRRPPTDAGYEEGRWTPALVGAHVESCFGVEYSESSCRRLLNELGRE
ncbi:helix-turn-helix domain-containing protein [Natronorarus salvus]|uniref:helix-turn-helix domain-containing protein n=1 Tax=Natronorarus salvus TaxID=3117733 RepID=UPI002F26B19A